MSEDRTAIINEKKAALEKLAAELTACTACPPPARLSGSRRLVWQPG